ncbi:hypothetical protein C2E31_20575 [Rhodopirellula baltica]|nr:hypothetical protein C2E31_20575 [Rhodopirellula baltica]
MACDESVCSNRRLPSPAESDKVQRTIYPCTFGARIDRISFSRMKNMFETPTVDRPLLVGLLVDVSGSMTSSIRNSSGPSQNRLQSFQSALGNLAERAKALSGKESGDRVKLFAYGFGFGNPLGAFFSTFSSPPVRDLLEGAARGSTTIGVNELANDWQRYKSHVEGLALKMFGATPMLEGVQTVAKRIAAEKKRINPSGTVLFFLSDGEPTDSTPDAVVKAVESLRDDNTLVVSCYVTDNDITSPRSLYGDGHPDWPRDARLMFDAASILPNNTPFFDYLREHQWDLQNNARLFTQINQSEVLEEFLQVIIAPLVGENESTDKSPTVFVSYSHKDSRWRDRLQVHLKPLVRDGAIDLWDDSRIRTGQDWRNEIDNSLFSANAAILLVSADFLASDFIAKNELPPLLDAARERGVEILPVIVGPSRYAESELAHFQAVNSPDSPLSKMKKQDAESVLVDLSRDVESIVS